MLVKCHALAGALMFASACLMGVVPAAAQTVVGRVVDAATSRDLGGALISAAAPDAGATIRRTIASGTGRFRVAVPVIGPWRITIAAIGYQPQSVVIPVATGDTLIALPVVRMVPRAYQLPEIVAASRGSTCRPDAVGGPVLEQLIREAETAFDLVQVSIDTRRLEFVSEVWSRRSFVGSTDTLRASVRSRSRASWPITSADHGLLQRDGFVHEDAVTRSRDGYQDNAGPVYYGPDASVLFSEWFLDSHCFQLTGDVGADSLRIMFVPRGTPDRPDVAGELVIDRRTSTLGRLVFRYVGLPRWVPAGEAGGEVGFRRLEDGLWIVNHWRLRAPIRHENLAPRAARVPRFELGGWAETGGSVSEVVGH